MTIIEQTHVPADDGRVLGATWHLPEGAVRGVVVVAPAMATPSAFYGPFATALADEGFAVLTFDYRGVEPGADIRSLRADLRTWADDAAAVLDSAHAVRVRNWPDLPLTWVGHSLGGQILGFVDHSLLDRAVVVASGHGYWRHNPPALRRWVRAFWHIVVPASVGLAGFYPGRRLHFLSDLPAGVMWQWRRWCLHAGYWQADVPDILDRHAALRVPVTAVHLTDDEILVEEGARAMLDQFVAAPTELVALTPSDLDATHVGHHGFFRARYAEAWRRIVVPRIAAASPTPSRVPAHA